MTAAERFTDEVLMAYADGELPALEHAALEKALAADPVLAARVARHRALREAVSAAFAPILEEPVPARLMPSPPVSAVVLPLVPKQVAPSPKPGTKRANAWRMWGGMAASLLIGLVAGSGLRGGDQLASGGSGEVAQAGVAGIAVADGRFQATGILADALNRQLASAPPAATADTTPVRIGISFMTAAGVYCRSFDLKDNVALAGLACREKSGWTIPLLTEVTPVAGSTSAYRTASSGLAPAVAALVDARIDGAALDAAGESAAMAGGWVR